MDILLRNCFMDYKKALLCSLCFVFSNGMYAFSNDNNDGEPTLTLSVTHQPGSILHPKAKSLLRNFAIWISEPNTEKIPLQNVADISTNLKMYGTKVHLPQNAQLSQKSEKEYNDAIKEYEAIIEHFCRFLEGRDYNIRNKHAHIESCSERRYFMQCLVEDFISYFENTRVDENYCLSDTQGKKQKEPLPYKILRSFRTYETFNSLATPKQEFDLLLPFVLWADASYMTRGKSDISPFDWMIWFNNYKNISLLTKEKRFSLEKDFGRFISWYHSWYEKCNANATFNNPFLFFTSNAYNHADNNSNQSNLNFATLFEPSLRTKAKAKLSKAGTYAKYGVQQAGNKIVGFGKQIVDGAQNIGNLAVQAKEFVTNAVNFARKSATLLNQPSGTLGIVQHGADAAVLDFSEGRAIHAYDSIGKNYEENKKQVDNKTKDNVRIRDYQFLKDEALVIVDCFQDISHNLLQDKLLPPQIVNTAVLNQKILNTVDPETFRNPKSLNYILDLAILGCLGNHILELFLNDLAFLEQNRGISVRWLSHPAHPQEGSWLSPEGVEALHFLTNRVIYAVINLIDNQYINEDDTQKNFFIKLEERLNIMQQEMKSKKKKNERGKMKAVTLFNEIGALIYNALYNIVFHAGKVTYSDPIENADKNRGFATSVVINSTINILSKLEERNDILVSEGNIFKSTESRLVMSEGFFKDRILPVLSLPKSESMSLLEEEAERGNPKTFSKFFKHTVTSLKKNTRAVKETVQNFGKKIGEKITALSDFLEDLPDFSSPLFNFPHLQIQNEEAVRSAILEKRKNPISEVIETVSRDFSLNIIPRSEGRDYAEELDRKKSLCLIVEPEDEQEEGEQLHNTKDNNNENNNDNDNE